MSLKDDIQMDFDVVFLDADEFADVVSHDGVEKRVLISSADDDYFTDDDTKILYGSKNDFQDCNIDDEIEFDDATWIVQDIKMIDGLYQIRVGRSNATI